MEIPRNALPTSYAPTETADLYPESDGKPMAETDHHIDAITRMRSLFRNHYKHIPDTYISGNLMMYYEDGRPPKAVSPDILISFGVGKKPRRTYKIWEEGKPPDFVVEFSSKGTVQNDLNHKMELYARLGIPEYFLCDVDRRYLPTPLMGFRLVDGKYVEIAPNADGGISSEILGLDFHLLADDFGIYDPKAGKWLQTAEEEANERAERDRERAERDRERAEYAETELARLREELARLKENPSQ